MKPLTLALRPVDVSPSLCSTRCSRLIMCSPSLESAISLKSPSSFKRKKTFISQDLGTRCAHCSQQVHRFKSCLWREVGGMCFYTQTDKHTHFYLSLPIYHLAIGKHDTTLTHSLPVSEYTGFIWLSPFPNQWLPSQTPRNS